MLNFKSCPRCRGDVVIENDRYGWYEQCLQCGYLRNMKIIVKAKQPLTQKETREELVRAV